ncbi:hypothetical protein BD779DRAFT_1516935 [Infundibulicybe gibba]|nr:hypothetical protein BD779DRAFT_1516935 [Infundibulicybe gibba]
MSGKTISTGTLSLKFMQNAHRAKHLKEVEAERAQVQDEAQWELPTARSALAAAPLTAYAPVYLFVDVLTLAGDRNTATHEASYLPFLFDSQAETETTVAHRPKGRRVFGKKGTEVDEVSRMSFWCDTRI